MPSAMPCAQCGASVPLDAAAYHACDPRRWLEFQMTAMTSAIASFDADLRVYLTSEEGRFEAWLAARDVRRSA